MRRTRGSSIKHELNIIPFMDVILVLLIIFMIFATSIIAQIKITLPASSSAKQNSSSKKNFLTLSVNNDGYVFCNNNKIGSITDKKKTMEQLQNFTYNTQDSKLSPIDTKTIIICCDKAIPYDLIIKLIDIAKYAGFSKLTLAAKTTR